MPASLHARESCIKQRDTIDRVGGVTVGLILLLAGTKKRCGQRVRN